MSRCALRDDGDVESSLVMGAEMMWSRNTVTVRGKATHKTRRDGVALGGVGARERKKDLTRKKTSRRRIEANLMGSKVNMNLPLSCSCSCTRICVLRTCLPLGLLG